MNEVLSILGLIVIGIFTQLFVSWAGSILHSIGTEETNYAVFTFRDDRHEPMTTNILMNVCIPNVIIVFVFILAKTYDLYYVNKYLGISVVSFFVWRMLWICVFLRRKEMYNWIYELGMALAGIALYYFIQLFFFTTEESVFISALELREELWLAIFVVLYKFFKMILDKKVKQDDVLSKGQITDYIRRKFNRFYKKFNNLLTINADNRYMCIFLYAVMIFEDYNRGPIVRKLERILLKLGLKRKATIGIMQFPTDENISDKESIIKFYQWLDNEIGGEEFIGDTMSINVLAWQYNNDTAYGQSVAYIYNRLYEYIDEVPKLRTDFCLRDETEESLFRNKVRMLKIMFEEGVISEEEFEKEKSNLISAI